MSKLHKVKQIVIDKSEKNAYNKFTKQIKELVKSGNICVVYSCDDLNKLVIEHVDGSPQSKDPVPYYLYDNEVECLEDNFKYTACEDSEDFSGYTEDEVFEEELNKYDLPRNKVDNRA